MAEHPVHHQVSLDNSHFDHGPPAVATGGAVVAVASVAALRSVRAAAFDHRIEARTRRR
ncbi:MULTISPECIES: hypothetical protein [Streptomyces]|uniref:hypothetical protein n=1 Tax=Streptomyces TaxID=1883 RepID=UPI001F450F8C|nr:hypothetical protein [Streptomyces noursei]MCE4945403.1 hypothetical protein [Streptomyces noursei]